MNKLHWNNNWNILFWCFLTWFSAGFVFVQIPAVSNELKLQIFPSTDTITSILMVGAVFSLSLLGRFIGGLVFGSLVNNYGIKASVYVLWVLTIVTILQCVIFLFVEQMNNNYILFIVFRIIIGFCVGGIWPNFAIYTLEQYYRKKRAKVTFIQLVKSGNDPDKINASQVDLSVEEFKHLKNAMKKDGMNIPPDNKERDKIRESTEFNLEANFRKTVQGFRLPSALIQIGFTFSFLIEAVILFIVFPISDMQFLKSQYVFTSFIGSVLLIITSIYWIRHIRLPDATHIIRNLSYKEKLNKDENSDATLISDNFYKKSRFINRKNSSLLQLLTNRKYRSTILYLWFITTGLMYMYYSTVVITPEFVFRYETTFPTDYIKIILLLSSAIGHFILGFTFNKKKILNLGRSSKFNLFYKTYRTVFQSDTENKEHRRRNFLNGLVYTIFDRIKIDKFPYQEKGDIEENRDMAWVLFGSNTIIWVVVGIIAVYSFFLFFDFTPGHIGLVWFIFIASVVLVAIANLPWALIPEILTSRFPKDFRFLAGSLTYNGGLLISFASPFILEQLLISFHDKASYYLILFPMLLGGLAIMYGSSKLIKYRLPKAVPSNNKEKEEYGFFDIRTPHDWNTRPGLQEDKIKELLILKDKGKGKTGEEWVLSILYLKSYNYPPFWKQNITFEVKQRRLLTNRVQRIEILLGMDIWEKIRLLILSKEKNGEIVMENVKEEIYINSVLSTKVSLHMSTSAIYNVIIFPYSSNVYVIIYRTMENDLDSLDAEKEREKDILLYVIDTFDIKIPEK